MRRLIRPGGEIVSLVFPVGDFEGGPPFALSPDVVKDLLEPAGFGVSLTEVPRNSGRVGNRSTCTDGGEYDTRNKPSDEK